jgi:hypothetical protein
MTAIFADKKYSWLVTNLPTPSHTIHQEFFE